MTEDLTEHRALWHPVAAGSDLVPAHLFHARLLGEELVLWRDSGGSINAWANRCPHRGLRLTLGRHCGTQLECRYHGLRFESQTGRCVRVPAHPGEPIAERLRVRVHQSTEKHGLVWVFAGTELVGENSMNPPTTLAASQAAIPAAPSGEPELLRAPISATVSLRAVAIHTSVERVLTALAAAIEAPADPQMNKAVIKGSIVARASLALTLDLDAPMGAARLHVLVQPAAPEKCVVHGLLEGRFEAATTRALVRQCSDQLNTLRDSIEGDAGAPASRNPFWRLEPLQ
ncbi:MAG: Rieske (2Fe-2S) protein [Betaproteobacteria bacterium]|nr:Rieske (2Fe-2S) protein [Betaproteobacteria bacterium]